MGVDDTYNRTRHCQSLLQTALICSDTYLMDEKDSVLKNLSGGKSSFLLEWALFWGTEKNTAIWIYLFITAKTSRLTWSSVAVCATLVPFWNCDSAKIIFFPCSIILRLQEMLYTSPFLFTLLSLEEMHLMNRIVIIPKSTSIFCLLLAVLPIESTGFANNYFKVKTSH